MFGIYFASRPPHFLEASDAHTIIVDKRLKNLYKVIINFIGKKQSFILLTPCRDSLVFFINIV